MQKSRVYRQETLQATEYVHVSTFTYLIYICSDIVGLNSSVKRGLIQLKNELGG